jgi:UDP-glucose 4-epimerase
MRIVITGSSGRVGRAIYAALASKHTLIGIDRTPFSTTQITADFVNLPLLTQVLQQADAVIHVAAFHAPHVGLVNEAEFERVNVYGTSLLIEAAQKAGVRRLVFTSTTAIFGHTIADGRAAWVTDDSVPYPRSIYHRTKVAAEALLQQAATKNLSIRVLRMSRCFPEQADLMAIYRLARGVDVRDVADAHVAALANDGPDFRSYIISGTTPFQEEDCGLLATDPSTILRQRAPALVEAFQKRDWSLPSTIDRVYVNQRAVNELHWQPRYGFDEVLAQLDRRSLEVLPAAVNLHERDE